MESFAFVFLISHIFLQYYLILVCCFQFQVNSIFLVFHLMHSVNPFTDKESFKFYYFYFISCICNISEDRYWFPSDIKIQQISSKNFLNKLTDLTAPNSQKPLATLLKYNALNIDSIDFGTISNSTPIRRDHSGPVLQFPQTQGNDLVFFILFSIVFHLNGVVGLLNPACYLIVPTLLLRYPVFSHSRVMYFTVSSMSIKAVFE